MKKYRIYIYTSMALVLFYLILIIVIIPTIVKYSMISNLDSNISLGKQEANEVAVICGEALKENIKKEAMLLSIQKAIEGTGKNTIYLSVVDWSGKIVSYPDVTQIGNIRSKGSNTISNIESTITGSELYTYIINREKDIENNDDDSEIIYLKSIVNSDWIIATHINLKNIESKISVLKGQLYILFLAVGLIISLFVLLIVRFISGYYETLLEEKAEKYEDGVLNLSKLNESLENYQKNVLVELQDSKKETVDSLEEKGTKESPKKRLLTYIRNELMPISIEDISYIYVENTITYIVRKDGKRFTANDSLDQIYSSLDEKLFFKVNRQIIVAIHAIDKILKYGNSALKIETNPVSDIDVIIGKNKASAFKQWLNI